MDTKIQRYSLVDRLRLLLWAMLLLPVLAGVAFFLLHSSRSLQGSAVRDLNATLSLQRQYIEHWVEDRERDIGFLADDPRLLALPPQALNEFLGRFLKSSDSFTDIVLVGEDGRTSADPRRASGVDLSDRDYFLAAREGKSFVSEVLKSRFTGESVFVVSSPVRDAGGRFRGMVFGTVSLSTLSTLMQTVREQSASSTFLVQADGALLAPSGAGKGLKAGDVLLERAKARKESRGIYRSVEGRRVVGTYQWIFGEKWLLAAERAEAEILADHALVLGVPLAGAALVFLLFGPAALRLARSLRAPLRQLEEHAQQIEAGNFGVQCAPLVAPDAPEEMRRLNQAYCLMVDRVGSSLEELRQTSFTDDLTGAANRKLLFSEGPRLVDAARRGGQSVSLLMLDLDHFKAVNDSHGHPVGDAVLAAFAALLQSTLRKSDLFARFGGEEFTILAPNAGSGSARELGERIRKAVERLEVPLDIGGSVRFTVSIGVASLEGGQGAGREPLDELLAKADEALYAAKSAGRNRVVVLELGTAAEAAPG